MTKQILSIIKVSALAIVFSIGISYAYAWTAPTVEPPTGNVSAPINTSGTAQSKAGSLGIGMTTTPPPATKLQVSNGNIQFDIPATSLANALITWPGGSPNFRLTDSLGVEKINVNSQDGGYTYFNSGNVGIGTASPAQKLDVNGEALVNGIRVGRGGGNVNSNTVIGLSSLSSNTTGTYNTASGYQALMSNTTGSGNTAIGTNAMYSNNGSNNIAVGNSTLYSNLSGGINVAIGLGAMNGNTTGYRNTAIGGWFPLYRNTTGSYNTAIGSDTLVNSTTGSYNTAIGYGADFSNVGLSNATAIGSLASVDVSNKVRIGNTAVTIIGGQVGWSALSDVRQKDNVSDYTHGLDFIMKLRPVKYNLKGDKTNKNHSGFIAQEVEATGIPFYGINRPETKGGYYSLNYSEFVVPLVNSVKELKAENDKLMADNEVLRAELKANNDAILARIEKLEATK